MYLYTLLFLLHLHSEIIEAPMKKAKLSADEAVKNTINKDSGMSIA
jgi:hypothetical protein